MAVRSIRSRPSTTPGLKDERARGEECDVARAVVATSVLSARDYLKCIQIVRYAAHTVNGIRLQVGRSAVVTGATAGIGRETAKVLARAGATVVLACRDRAKAEALASEIERESEGRPHVVELDLASLASVRHAATAIRERLGAIDLLLNNAGVMAIPFARSRDGYELTFATNHLGHFALTGLLIDRMTGTPGARVVTVSSVAHRRANADFGGFDSDEGYTPGRAYDRSKLANLLFAYELQHRLAAAGSEAVSLACHPGIVRSDLWRTSSRLERALLSPALRPLTFWLAQDPAAGALPTLCAALDPAASGGEYYGPSGRFEYTGAATRVESSAVSHDRDAQRKLWELSEELTGISYPLAR
jgi:NAD(P)-dependent dehydrogenase (short-subunit alcohol dehydrogenase family)